MNSFEEIFQKRYDRLNAQQKEAVDTIEGPVMVIAGPGSGKTELLGLRVANILRSADINPSNILCLTFTDAAAVNMRDRLSELLGPEAYRVAIHTFHSFGQRIIEDYPIHFFGSARFSAVDELVQYEVIHELLEKLPSDHPLSSIHPQQGYVYLRDIKSAISNLKRAAITPEEFKIILKENENLYKAINEQVANLGANRVNLKNIDDWLLLSRRLSELGENLEWSNDFYPHPALTLKRSLDRAVAEATNIEKTSPLSEWKRKYLTKTATSHTLKDIYHHDKLLALANVYQQYENVLHSRGYFDFDDMLVSVVDRLRNDESLLYEVSEQYQYILIDEFQDTNDAQLKLALSVARPQLHDNRPNIMAVGDDDQAINRFQGADISNIKLFTSALSDTKFIVLTKNYRSHADIIDLAKKVIRQGTDRLENTIEEIDKELMQANDSITDVDIRYRVLPSIAHEYSFIAEEIKHMIDNGVEPSSIAVLGREHRQLQALVTHLYDKDIPVRYERNLDVLKQKHIRELIQMARYVYSLSNPEIEVSDELLPEILSYDFWQLDRLSVWKLGRYAYQNRSSWQEAMQQSDNEQLHKISEFFARLSEFSLHEPMEVVIDHLIGSANGLLTYDTTDEYDTGYRNRELIAGWHCPFREYYFGANVQTQKRALYIAFLSNLRVFVKTLREYKQGEYTTLADLVKFVDLHEQYGRLVADTSPFVSAENSVHVMTAHKSKGQEFDTVFVINAVDEIWAKTRNSSKLSFPQNLPIEPAGTTQDDNLRLFFVAITRAKNNLYISGYKHSDKGADINEIRFISGLVNETEVSAIPEVTDILTAEMHVWHNLPPAPDEVSYLKELVENYQLSVTHLNTFLDVTRGGPQTFFEQNLLRFPQGKTPASSYGSAIHSCIEHFYRKFKEAGKIPPKEELIDCFQQAISLERLAKADINRLRDRGEKSLQIFYDHLISNASLEDIIEKNFKYEGVQIEDVSLTGKIDRMTIDKESKTALVTDYKTGSAVSKWTTSGYEGIKLHNYQRQLIFYKILVENSNSYKNLTVTSGQLEFIEPDDDGRIVVLDHKITDTEVERTTNLIKAVGNLITNLEFPKIDKYPDNLKGIIEFEDDLIKEYEE